MLALRGLAVRRGRQLLLEDLDLGLHAGDLVTLVGPNGAGKTSLLRVIAGLSEPDAGACVWRGRALAVVDPEYAAQRLYLGHLPGLKADLSVGENLDCLLRIAGESMPARAHRAEALRAIGLAGHEATPVRQLSAGQRRRAGLARLALSRSLLWLLDEPLTNLDSEGQHCVATLLERHLGDGGIALVASHAPLPVSPPGRHLQLRLGR